jgi:hypothetical protein
MPFECQKQLFPNKLTYNFFIFDFLLYFMMDLDPNPVLEPEPEP